MDLSYIKQEQLMKIDFEMATEIERNNCPGIHEFEGEIPVVLTSSVFVILV